MSFNEFKAFFVQLFSALNTKDSFMILLFLLVSFLIGWLFGRLSLRSKYRKLQRAFQEKETELITVNANFTALKERYSMREEELKAARSELEDFEAAHRRLEAEKGQLSGELYTAKDQVDQLKIANNKLITQIASLENNISELRTADTEQQTNQLVSADEVEEVSMEDLEGFNDIRDNYQKTFERINTIEKKLAALELENAALNKKVVSFENAEVLTIPAISEEEEDSSEERSAKARLELTRVLGNRIEKVSAADRDDLKKINGIGPFIEEKLNGIGIYTFKQISQFDEEFIGLVTDAIQFFPGRIVRDNWVGQAKKLK